MADTWIEAVAEDLHTAGLVDYQPAAVTGDCAIAHVPDEPDEAVMLWPEPGDKPYAGIPTRWPRLQARIRGSAYGDRTAPYERALAIFERLHDRRGLPFTGGRVACIDGRGSGPMSIGNDAQGRPEWTCNFDVTVNTV